jgi:EAL domain-containing protein (putative c-di-GMP-specific phosphodiesterase class I)
LEILRRFGCDEFQGFLYSPAVPSPEFEHQLRVALESQPLVREDVPAVAAI